MNNLHNIGDSKDQYNNIKMSISDDDDEVSKIDLWKYVLKLPEEQNWTETNEEKNQELNDNIKRLIYKK